MNPDYFGGILADKVVHNINEQLRALDTGRFTMAFSNSKQHSLKFKYYVYFRISDIPSAVHLVVFDGVLFDLCAGVIEAVGIRQVNDKTELALFICIFC